MIKLNPSPTFDAKVRLTVPGQDEPAEVQFTFRHMPLDKMQPWFLDNRERAIAEALDEIIAGWSGVQDESGAEVAYSCESLGGLLNNYQPAAQEIIHAWQFALAESRVKN